MSLLMSRRSKKSKKRDEREKAKYPGVRAAVDGNTAVIGVRVDDDNGNSSGSAYK